MNEILIASMCGTLCQVGPVIPVELLKTRLQVQRERVSHFSKHPSTLYSGPVDCLKQIVKQEGPKGLFKGGPVIVLRDMIGYLFYIPVYESLMRVSRKKGYNETASQLVSGGCAGISGWISVCPLEVVKNRMQADKTGRKESARQLAARIYREEGARSFFKGGLALCLRGFVVNAVIFLVYENAFSFVEKF